MSDRRPISSPVTTTWRPHAPPVTVAKVDEDGPVRPGDVIASRYRVVREIGRGGMGHVYEVEHVQIGRRMALKLLNVDRHADEHLARFRQEARLTSQVGHPAIVEVVDFARTEDGTVYLAMELLRGRTLEEWLARPGSLLESLPWIAEFARGLHAAHLAGVVHRDIKPSNLFLHEQWDKSIQPKILDFGIAKDVRPDNTRIETIAGTLLGTPYYLAPERCLGRQLDARADLYSLGVILYEMLTGWVPFRASSFAEVLGQHAREQPLDPRQAAPSRKIPDSIAELTMQLLAKDPNERPSTGAELAEHIDALVRADRAVLQVLTGPRVRSNADEATVSVSAVRGAPTSIGKLPAGNETVVLAGQPSKQAERGRERKWVWWIGASAGIGVALALWVFAAPRPDLPRAAQEPAAVPGQPTREVPIRGLEHPTEPPFEPPVPTNARVPPDLGATSNVAEVRGNAKTEQDAESPPPKPDPSRPRRAPTTRRRSPAAQQKAAPTGGLPGPALQFKDEVYDD